jgi:methyl-accepting chemotaxis protein
MVCRQARSGGKVAFKYRSSLQRTMIIYFLLIGFASTLVGVEFVVDTNKAELRSELLQNFGKLSRQEISPDVAFRPLQVVRDRAVVMVVVILLTVLILLTMFIKNITEPLQHMIDISRQISKGDLSRTIAIRSTNELAELGNVINDLTSNMQEMTLLAKEMCVSSNDFLAKMADILSTSELERESVTGIGSKMESLDRRIKLLNKIIEEISLFGIEKK